MHLLLVFFLSAAISISSLEEISATASPPPPTCRFEERAALLDFKRLVDGGAALDSWNAASTSSCCEWVGIKCRNSSHDDDDSRRFTAANISFKVISIEISGAKLGGIISPSIAALQALEILNLSKNRIFGSIPPGISSLPRLRIIDLSRNNLTGLLNVTFPPSLEVLKLRDNSFNGSLPSFATLPRLQYIDLSTNYFMGEIPADFGCAKFINISINILTGSPLPHGCGDSINFYYAGNNYLDGTLSSLSKFSSLRILHLHVNCIVGKLPDELGNLTQLEELILDNNEITGQIPPSIANCSSLKILSMKHNNLQGELDHLDFSNLRNLSVVDMSFNMLSGTIPASILQPSLKTLALGKNSFVGEIPDSFGQLKQLQSLSISANQLVGGLPPSLQECSSLASLVISKNLFTEPLPGNWTGFKKLQVLAIGNANLHGSIPSWLANCDSLQLLDLSWNKLEGEIPRWFGSMQHLFYVDLSNNSLSGELPMELTNMTCLREEDNSGLKPPAYPNTLFVKHRANTTALQYNQVTSFPPSLILGSNKLTGNIPWEFGRLRKLNALDLSHNWITGNIPASLADANDLEYLDLSCNRLRGAIPGELTNLTFLSTFNVSYNQLEGQIPASNQFSSFPPASYLGNLGLCGENIGKKCPSPAPSPGPASRTTSSGRLRRVALMGVTISISLGLTALFAAMLILSFSRRGRNRDGHDDLEENFKELSLAQMMSLSVTMFQRDRDDQIIQQTSFQYNHLSHQKQQQQEEKITVGDLIRATDNFDASNIIGCGGFGLVFKAHLPPNGKVVAIKRLTGEEGGPQMEKEFDAELMTLGKISHQNLVPLEGYCRLGSRDRLLVYAYMENGSLDYWLHERADGGLRLSWKRRVDILRGAARGLEYLHCRCVPHIVHRDIKSSNILLDSSFRAHVADFGLARLMLPSDTHVTTELVGTLGYIPPEYAQSAVASLRGDVYSFGVLILEVLSRRRPVDVGAVARRRGARDLVPWVRSMCAAGRGREILDPLLLTEEYSAASTEEMLRVLNAACRCVDACPQRRPAIEDVVLWLHNSS